MNKKLTKTRTNRINTLEAMDCACGTCICDCLNCSAGGSMTATEGNYRKNKGQLNKREARYFA